jgi:methylmalonyl-CoA/ethylmalonyl-CoA epimerase
MIMSQDAAVEAAPQIPDAVAIDHIGIAVADVDAAVAFYRSALGLVETHREINAEQQVTEAMLGTATEFGGPEPAGSALKSEPVGSPAVPDTPAEAVDRNAAGEPANASAPLLQLLAPTSDESAIAKFLQRSGPGIHHLAYRVADLDAATARLHRRGLRMLYHTGRAGTHGSLINFLHPKDGGGVLIELVQPARIAQ